MKSFFNLFILLSLIFLPGCQQNSSLIRIGYLGNLTHAQVLVGLSRGDFGRGLGPLKKVEAKVFNAGPSVVEALFGGAIDLAYLGPMPAINAFVRSNGEFVIVAGTASGGAAVVVRKNSGIYKVEDFHGRRLTTPQLGNTQDVNARAFFLENGFKFKEAGGDLAVIPVANPDQLTLFQKREVDAAWTVEPWVSRLVLEAGGQVLFDESAVWTKWTGEDYPTTVVVVRKSFLNAHPDLVKNLLKVHVEITQWINEHPQQAMDICNQELTEIMGKPLPEEVLRSAWSRIRFADQPSERSLRKVAENAVKVGFMPEGLPDISKILQLDLLREVLSKQEQTREPKA